MSDVLLPRLIAELPALGGWPEWAHECVLHSGAQKVMFYDEDGRCSHQPKFPQIEFDKESDVGISVSREQYEAALAASKPEWDGEGLPPVGEKCEFISNGTSWGDVYVIGIDGGKVVFRPSGETYYGIAPSQRQIFRPIRSEADKKRDEAIKQICEVLSIGKNTEDDAKNIYEYIKSGKIVID